MADECLADGDWCGWWLAPGAKDGSSGRLTGSARVCGCKGRDVAASGLRRRADRNHVKSNTMVERLGQQAAVRFRLGGAEHVLLA